MTHFSCILALVVSLALTWVLPEQVQAQEGSIGIYFDQHRGRPTASGELYEPAALTAAHEFLPLGSFVRVTNVANGRAVNARVNDRKPRDGQLLYLSGAAGRELGLAPGQSAMARVEVRGQGMAPQFPAPPTAAIDARVRAEQVAREQQAAAVQQGQKVRNGLFQKKQSWESAAASQVPNGGAIPPGTAPVVASAGTAQGGGFFSRIFGRKSAEPVTGGFRGNAYEYPEPSYQPDGRVIPMSAPYPQAGPTGVGQMSSGPAPVYVPAAGPGGVPAASSASIPGASTAPYKVQFGAYRKAKSAEELTAGLLQSGIPTMVVQSTANQLFLVVTRNGFRTASEAQRWIDFEGARRGWRERPVVIR